MQAHWSRRTFLAALGASAATAYAAPHDAQLIGGATLLHEAMPAGVRTSRFLHGAWKPVAETPARNPVALAAHPHLPVLYVAQNIRWRNQPRASVLAVRFDRMTGAGLVLGEQPLSLSATDPRALAVSADGRSLLAGAFGGGAWNAFALDQDGAPKAYPDVLKETGRGADPVQQQTAHPAAALAIPGSPYWLVADYGTDHISVLQHTADGLFIRHRHALPAGSGPSHMQVLAGQNRLVVMTTLRPALYTLQISTEPHLQLQQLQVQTLPESVRRDASLRLQAFTT